MTLHGGSSSATIRHVFIQRSDTGPRERLWTSCWEWRRPRKLTGIPCPGNAGQLTLTRRGSGVMQAAGALPGRGAPFGQLRERGDPGVGELGQRMISSGQAEMKCVREQRAVQ